MSILTAFSDADQLSKSFSILASKAASPAGGGSPYSTASASISSAFGDTQDLSNAAKQYGALRDIPYTAIRPIAVKVASQEIMLGYKASKKPAPDVRKLRTKSHEYLHAPQFLKKKIAEGLDPQEDHFLLDLFETPNPYMSGWAMRYCTGMSICATGDAYWWIQRGDDGLPAGLWYFPKTWITPIHEPAPFTGYKIRPPNAPESGSDLPIVPAADMLHFRFPDPGDPLKSLSPMQTQARAINTDDEIQKAQFASMRNGIHPSVILRAGRLPPKPGESGQGPMPNLTPEQRRQLIDTIRLHYSGAAHYGDPIIVDGMIEGVEKFASSPADLDFPNGSGLTKDRIMQGIGTNPIVAGQIENANRASAYVAHQGFYDIVVNPILALMSATFTARLGPSDSAAGRKLYIWIEEARAEDEDLNLAKMTAAQAAQAVTKNEWREFCGLKKTDNPEDDKPPVPPPDPMGGPPGMGAVKPKPGDGGKPKPPKAAGKSAARKLRKS